MCCFAFFVFVLSFVSCFLCVFFLGPNHGFLCFLLLFVFTYAAHHGLHGLLSAFLFVLPCPHHGVLCVFLISVFPMPPSWSSSLYYVCVFGFPMPPTWICLCFVSVCCSLLCPPIVDIFVACCPMPPSWMSCLFCLFVFVFPHARIMGVFVAFLFSRLFF